MQGILEKTALFYGLTGAEIEGVVFSAGGILRRYEAGEVLWHQGEVVTSLGIVLHGAVEAMAYSCDGGAELVAHHGAGQVVGDVLVARQDTEMLLLPMEGLYPLTGEVSTSLRQVQRNLLAETGEKFWQQRRRIAYLVEPRLRQRVLRYLRDEAPAAGAWFTLPLDRQGMARFLGADRSALSRVLSQLRDEGLIGYRKSEFWVK